MADSNGIQQLIRQQLEDLQRAGVQQLPTANAENVAQMAAAQAAQSSNAANQQTIAPEAVTPAPVTSTVAQATEAPTPPAPTATAPPSPAPTPSAPAPPAPPQVEPPTQPAKPALPQMANTETPPTKSDLPAPARLELLEALNGRVKSCTKCAELCSSRTQTVFGVGNPSARLVFLGEAPGADEDKQGEPFVGAAGQLLDKIIQACTLSRSDVYILNILKCRPPGNRNPTDEESNNCAEFLQAQLDIIQPEYICCLGSVAAKNLLNTQTTIGRLRGKFHDWRGIQVLATYHPAYLLRNPSAKGEVWKDMQFLMQAMGIELPKKG